MGLSAVLFDVDETLFDRERAQGLVLDRLPAALPDLFGDMAQERLHEAWVQSDRETENHVYTVSDLAESRRMRSAVFLRILDMDQTHADTVTGFYLETYPTVPSPMAGAAEVVAACAAQLPVGVVSNAYPDVQYGKIETLGVRHHLRCVVLSEEYGGPRKPAAEIFLHGCELLGSQPATTLYVGDSFGNDVVGALGAGLIPCWYNPRQLPAPEGETLPRFQLRTLRELLALV